MKNIKPMFSVIIPIYKVEQYLHQCIDSIIKQNYEDYELILVDDGSPDNCPQICDEYAKKYNKIKVIHKENGGLVSARKAGCKVANGQYILNVDGDDWVDQDYFLKLHNIIKENSPDIIQFKYKLCYGNKQKKIILPYKNGFYSKNEIKKYIYPILIESKKGQYFPPTVWTKAIKRELYTQFQLTVDERISIDEDFACTKPIIYAANNLYMMDEYLYNYRQNEQSMTRNRTPFNLEAPQLIAKHFESTIIMDDDMKMQVYRNLVHNLFNAIISQFNRTDNMKITDIKNSLKNPYNRMAVVKCKYHYKYFKGNIAKFILKHKSIFLLKLVYIFRNNGDKI